MCAISCSPGGTRSSPSTTSATGDMANLAHLSDRPGFEFVQHDVSLPFDVAGPVEAVMHLASPASPRDYLALPIETLKVGSLGTFNTLGSGPGPRAPATSWRRPARCTAILRCIPSRRTTGGTSIPWGRGACTTRPSASPRRPPWPITAVRRRRAHQPDVQHLRAPHAPPATAGWCLTSSSRPCRASRSRSTATGRQTRSFCYVDDQVAGLVALLDSDYVGPVNIGNPDEFTVLELAGAVLEMTGSRVGDRLRAPARRRPDPAPPRHHPGRPGHGMGTAGAPGRGTGADDPLVRRTAQSLTTPTARSRRSRHSSVRLIRSSSAISW